MVHFHDVIISFDFQSTLAQQKIGLRGMVGKTLRIEFSVIDSDLSIRIKNCVVGIYVFLLLWYLGSHYVQAPGHFMYRIERQCLLCSLVGELQVTWAKSTLCPVGSVGKTRRGSVNVDINKQNIFVHIVPYIDTQT